MKTRFVHKERDGRRRRIGLRTLPILWESGAEYYDAYSS